MAVTYKKIFATLTLLVLSLVLMINISGVSQIYVVYTASATASWSSALIPGYNINDTATPATTVISTGTVRKVRLFMSMITSF